MTEEILVNPTQDPRDPQEYKARSPPVILKRVCRLRWINIPHVNSKQDNYLELSKGQEEEWDCRKLNDCILQPVPQQCPLKGILKASLSLVIEQLLLNEELIGLHQYTLIQTVGTTHTPCTYTHSVNICIRTALICNRSSN